MILESLNVFICFISGASSFAFKGLPKYSILAVGGVGSCKKIIEKKNFIDGFKVMISELHPIGIVYYGVLIEEIAKMCYDNNVEIRVYPPKNFLIFKEVR